MDTNFTPKVAPLELDDIPRLIDCVRRCYGDSYTNPMMYDPVQLKEAVLAKLLHSVVAKLDDGQIIGHCALTFDDHHNTSPEAGKMMVDPNYRGHHIAESIAKERIEIAKSLGLAGFWTECVTNHPYSQHEMIAFDAKETGLFIGDVPASFSMQGLQNFSDTRMSLLAFYLLLKDHPHTIYSPPQHTEHLKDLVESLNMTRDIQTSSTKGSGSTKLKTKTDSLDQTANISISHIGEDLIPMVMAELKKIEALSLATVYLDLPIEQDAAASAYSALEELGFFWGSWIPNYTAHKDILRLQKIYQSVNVNEIICAREQGEEVKRYVISEWQKVSGK
ncbi:GNAT family N-acetyltransferase [Polynucleobacter sp. 73C-SIWE]|uniref:GNAT family N-acetyltransferase n=1 Tax=Polynucleobacter sp. 73C-SIWE TaxID=2689098 RepID=UPI001C0D7A6E|nr:GNAT family N-acetyltransferase [Polynucleobacter sp. 73C-SIWE]MBU3578535.1 GNAT family N-acetyltransferase [Polynucleobacter sp. 73C-SIWE]